MITESPAAKWISPYAGTDDPRQMLLEYQHRYWFDKARFKFGLWSRQTGKDFTSEGECVEDCLLNPKTSWMVAAPSERQSHDSLEKGKEWAAAMGLKIADYQERREGGSESLLKSAEIIFANGSRIRAVPGKPDTVRGTSSNVLLTEFDFFEDPDATWRAILPSITNPLRGGLKKVRIITTPNGIGSAGHKIWAKDETAARVKWSRHKVTIEDAVRMGLPVDIEELKEIFADPDGWAQEFMCEFLDTVSTLLPYELLATCESFEATSAMPPEYWETTSQFAVDLGIDFGRKRDLTVCWAGETISAALSVTKEVLELSKMPTPQQVEILRPRIRKARRVALDYTGPGIGMGDYLVAEFGEWKPSEHKFGKIELCTFTNAFKCDIFPKVRMCMERHGILTPVSRLIREDLHSVNRVVTAAGNVTYSAPHTADGHADRCTGLALYLHACEGGTGGAITAETLAKIRIGGGTATPGARAPMTYRRLRA